MAAPFVVACSHCQSKLKLKDSSLAGKKIRCPKCQEIFVVPGGKGAAAKKPAKPKDEFDFSNISEDDYEPPPSDDGEQEEFDELPMSPVAKRKATAKSGGKKKKRASDGPGFGKVALIGAVVLFGIGLVGGVGYGVYLLIAGMGGGPGRLAWLPDDIEFVVEVHVADAWNSGVLRPLREGEIGKTIGEKMKGESHVDPSDIDRVIIGAKPDQNVPVIVTYANKPIDPNDLSKDATSAEYGGYTLYSKPNQPTAFLADPRTLVIGPEDKLKAAIDRKGVCPVAERFSHLPTRGTIVLAANKLPQPEGPGAAMFQTPGIDPTKLSSLSATVSLSNDIGIDFSCVCPDAATSESIVQAVEKDKAEGLAQLQAQRSQVDSNPMLKLSGMGKMLDSAEAALKSYHVASSGTTVTGGLTVPGKIVKDAADAMGPMFSMMMNQFPGAGSSGEFTPPPGGFSESDQPPNGETPPVSEHGETP